MGRVATRATGSHDEPTARGSSLIYAGASREGLRWWGCQPRRYLKGIYEKTQSIYKEYMKKHGHSIAQYIKAMALVNGQVVLPDVKMPRKKFVRAKETRPRNQEEALYRKEVIKELRRHGCFVRRIENSITRELGNDLPDLLVFTNDLYPPIKMVWVELKSSTGVLSYGQQRFRDLCVMAGIKHIVPKTGDDVWSMIKQA